MSTKEESRRNLFVPSSGYVWLAAVVLLAALVALAWAALSGRTIGTGSIQRGIDADSARYQALGAYYLAQAEFPTGIRRGVDADAARYQALAEYYGFEASQTSVLEANPELMVARRFYRASADALALNPELMVARRFYGAPADTLAINPELMFARRFYRAPADALALNPELNTARRYYMPSQFAACSQADDRAADGQGAGC